MSDPIFPTFHYSHYANGQHAATRTMVLALASLCGKEREFRTVTLRLLDQHLEALEGDPAEMSRRLAFQHAREWLSLAASPRDAVCTP